jgi:NTP pyrophosphatase (non-canonical NTP hydrolase)
MSLLKSLHNAFGEQAYSLKIVEELAELSVAYLHWRDGKAKEEEVIDEIADVFLQITKVINVLADFDEDKVNEIINRIESQGDIKSKNLTRIIRE